MNWWWLVAGALFLGLAVAMAPASPEFVSPAAGSELALPARVVLQAGPGSELGVRLVDACGRLLAEDAARADERGRIELSLYWDIPASDTGRLEVFLPVPGREERVLSAIPVRLPSVPCSWVKVYFLDPSGRPFPLVRRVPRTPAVATQALKLLLSGPTWRERQYGYWSALPPGARLVGLDIASGEAIVRLDASLSNLAPELSALALREIALTLSQFPTIGRVRVYSGGKVFSPRAGSG